MNVTTTRVAIIGAHASPVGRFSSRTAEEIPDCLEQDILADVASLALKDADIAPSEIDAAIFTQNPPTTRQLGFATFMQAYLGLTCRGLVTEVGQLGITGGVAFDVAAAQVQLGHAQYALALGVVNQSAGDPNMALDNGIRAVGDVNFQAPFAVPPVGWYAFDCARYMQEHGVERSDIARVAIKSRLFSRHNFLAQFTSDLSLNEVLTARTIAEPLGLFEVPARADGAICLVVTTEETARKSNKPYVIVSGRGFFHEGYHQIGMQPQSMTEFKSAFCATSEALKQSGKVLDEIDIFELYAPCTITEILVSEAIGLFPSGQACEALLAGRTGPDGDRPINTSGGCLARGHPPQLTGLYGLFEIREQLLGRCGKRQILNPTSGLHTCELGNYNATLAHVLELP
ncbi:MAG: thiolase family protein [Halieaceae bacterium]|nr:thiolase family protein [Halieaceae bacterium]